MLKRLDLGAAGSSEEWFDLWADTVRPLSDITQLAGDSPALQGRARAWMLDRLVFCEGVFGGQISHRDRRRHAAKAPNALVLQTYLRGAFDGEIAGEPLRIGLGEVNVTDYSRGHRGRSTATHVRSLVIAHELVGYDPSRHPPTMRFGVETVVGRVLRQTLLAVHADLDRTTQAEAPRIAQGLIGLLRNILFSDPAEAQMRPDFAAARARAIRAHVDARVERHGEAAEVTAETISAQFNVSRSTLYRDFKEDGGIERFITGRRLEAALTALAFGPAERGAVGRAAERFGFASTAHFSREFRRRFGFAPSDVVGGRAPSGATGAGARVPMAGGPGDVMERLLRSV